MIRRSRPEEADARDLKAVVLARAFAEAGMTVAEAARTLGDPELRAKVVGAARLTTASLQTVGLAVGKLAEDLADRAAQPGGEP